MVVNLGSIFEEITQGKFKATFHRVLDIHKERFSCPFFFEPSYTTPIPLNLLDGQAGETIMYGEWWAKNQMGAGEWKAAQIKQSKVVKKIKKNKNTNK